MACQADKRPVVNRPCGEGNVVMGLQAGVQPMRETVGGKLLTVFRHSRSCANGSTRTSEAFRHFPGADGRPSCAKSPALFPQLILASFAQMKSGLMWDAVPPAVKAVCFAAGNVHGFVEARAYFINQDETIAKGIADEFLGIGHDPAIGSTVFAAGISFARCHKQQGGQHNPQ